LKVRQRTLSVKADDIVANCPRCDGIFKQILLEIDS